MTPKERAAMQQALEALDVLLTEPMAKIAADKAEALLLRSAPALREALAEQPVRTKDLTDDEIFKTNKTELPDCQDLVDFARAVIVADREKNK